MNVALFGGTFDPIHLGHLALARAARERFQLARVHFVPAYIPPHKQGQAITPFSHRYAMVALATAGDAGFVPSLLESPEQANEHGANYTIDTVARFRRQLAKRDRLFVLVGIDAFLDIAHWHEPERLLSEVEFIVVSRPGFSLADVGAALPPSLRPAEPVKQALRGSRQARFRRVGVGRQPAVGEVVLPGITIHLLEGVAEKVSATQIRNAAARGRSLDKLVGPAVAEYIRKQRLYRDGAAQ